MGERGRGVWSRDTRGRKVIIGGNSTCGSPARKRSLAIWKGTQERDLPPSLPRPPFRTNAFSPPRTRASSYLLYLQPPPNVTHSLSHLSTSSPPHWLLFFKNPPSLALVFEISLDSRESAREGKNIYWDYFTFRQRERGNVSWRKYILRFLRLELYISPEKEGIIIRSDIFEFVSSSIPRKDVLQEERRSCLSSPIYSIYIRKGTVSFLPRLDEG